MVPLQRALGSKLNVAFRVFFFTIPLTLLTLKVVAAVRFGEQARVLGDELVVVVSSGVSEDCAIKESEFVSVVVVLSLPFLRSVIALLILAVKWHSSSGRLLPLSTLSRSSMLLIRCIILLSRWSDRSILYLSCGSFVCLWKLQYNDSRHAQIVGDTRNNLYCYITTINACNNLIIALLW